MQIQREENMEFLEHLYDKLNIDGRQFLDTILEMETLIEAVLQEMGVDTGDFVYSEQIRDMLRDGLKENAALAVFAALDRGPESDIELVTAQVDQSAAEGLDENVFDIVLEFASEREALADAASQGAAAFLEDFMESYGKIRG